MLPEIDGELIEYVGEADFDMKCDLLSQADCLLAPITWNEPFGLFMVEAMACGAPVIAFGLGSVPEVVDEGVTGYVVSTVSEMVSRLDDIDRIDRATCRSAAEARFDVSRMVRDYVGAYERILDRTEYQPGRPGEPVPIVA